MKYFLSYGLPFTIVFLCYNSLFNSPKLSVIFTIATFIGIRQMIIAIRKRAEIERFKERFENVYVISNSPKANIPLDLSDALLEICVFIEFADVMKECSRIDKSLIEAENKHYVNDQLKDSQRLKIVPIIFRDGEHINETWSEFKQRVVSEIHEDRRERHRILKEASAEWYHKFGNSQREVVWNKTA